MLTLEIVFCQIRAGHPSKRKRVTRSVAKQPRRKRGSTSSATASTSGKRLKRDSLEEGSGFCGSDGVVSAPSTRVRDTNRVEYSANVQTDRTVGNAAAKRANIRPPFTEGELGDSFCTETNVSGRLVF